MTLRFAAAAAFAAALLSTSCVQLEKPPAPENERPAEAEAPVLKPRPAPKPRVVIPEPTISPLDTLLSEFERFRRLSPADLAREQEAARQAFAQTKSDASRVQLAMALTVPGSPPGEDARALEALEPIVRNTAAPLHGLAFMLAAHILEQRRLSSQVQSLQQNNQGLQQNVQALQQNLQGLQQKLDALRTLERSMSERAEPVPRKR